MDKFFNKKRNFDENEFSNENSLNAKKPALRKLIGLIANMMTRIKLWIFLDWK